MIQIMTSGESHGKAVSVIIEGVPAGIEIDIDFINHELKRRQQGYGRGKRMSIEKDRVEILAGVRFKRTLGSPIHLFLKNQDYANWRDLMQPDGLTRGGRVTAPRPGHADLAGFLKYGTPDIRDVLERASARETAARVMAGAVFKLMLKNFGVEFSSRTLVISDVEFKEKRIRNCSLKNPLYCGESTTEKKMVEVVDRAKELGDTVGGVTEVIATGVCPGIGSYVHYARRLDAMIGSAMFSIPSVKGVEIGDGFANARKPGSRVHDEIFYTPKKGFYRRTNRAGGIEGGVSNGEDIVVRLAVKPIPTLKRPLKSVDVVTKRRTSAQKERADVCVVPAVGVIGEAMLAFVLAQGFVEKFGGDTLIDMKSAYELYIKRIKNV